MKFTTNLLLCFLIGTTQISTASSLPFTVESDGSYSYFLNGNTLSFSNSGNIIIGGHNAINPGVNLISYLTGQIQIGGFFDLNNVGLGNYESGYGDAFSVSTSSSSSLSVSTPGNLTINATINGFDYVNFSAGNEVNLTGSQIVLGAPGAPGSGGDPGGAGSISICLSSVCGDISVIQPPLMVITPCGVTGCPLINNGGNIILNPVPLPSSLALLLSGLGLMGFSSRRIQTSSNALLT